MGKRKRFNALPSPPPHPNSHPLPAPNEEGLTDECIATTNDTLRYLLLNPHLLLTSAALKPIRLNLYSLLKSLSLSSNVKLFSTAQISSVISDAMDAGNWSDALVALHAMESLKKEPKLGSLQRWISRIAWDDEEQSRALLTLMIKVSGAAFPIPTPDSVWNKWVSTPEAESARHPPLSAKEFKFELLKNVEDINYKHVKIWRDVLETKLFQSPTNASMSTVDFVPGSIALSNVLSSAECTHLIEVAESIGFEDASGYAMSPETSSLDRGASGLVWCLNSTNTAALFTRISRFLPPILPLGALAGINSRFRFYKYLPGAIYKPHIDGAWPASGYTPDGDYLIDAFGDRHSRLTLIIYLNDGNQFLGGHTRFYGLDGDKLAATSVVPMAGCSLIFPHGDASAGIVHEGEALTAGVKYIIRSDILYLNH